MKNFAYKPDGTCIYCGTRGVKLSNEHIIPYGLNGSVTLPKASCSKCRDATSAVEFGVLRGLFMPLRLYTGARTRRPNSRPETVRLIARFRDPSRPNHIDVPLDQYPAMCAVVVMDRPRLLGPGTGKDQEISVVMPRGLLETDLQLSELAAEHGAVAIDLDVTLDPNVHRMFLAKVAHCFAVARLGLHAFQPFLPKPLLANDIEAMKNFVGTAEIQLERIPKEDWRNHQVQVLVDLNGTRRILVRLALFSRFGLPTYDVLAGRLK